MPFKIRKVDRPIKMVRTKTGKARASLLQPLAYQLEFREDEFDPKSLRIAFGKGPRDWLSRIIDENKALLRQAGIPDRKVVLTTDGVYRRLTAKEKAAKALPPGVITIRGEQWVQIEPPEYRELTDIDRSSQESLPLADPSMFCAPDSTEGYAAAAIDFAETALEWIDRDDQAHVLGIAMRAVDYHWKAFLSQSEPALLVGLDICGASKRQADPQAVANTFKELRKRHPRWGATAIRQAAAELLKEKGRGYSFESLKKYPVPGLPPSVKRRKAPPLA